MLVKYKSGLMQNVEDNGQVPCMCGQTRQFQYWSDVSMLFY